MLRESDVAHIPPNLFGIVDGRADFQIGAALRAHSDIDFEYALQKFGAAVIFHFMLINGDGIEAFAGLGL